MPNKFTSILIASAIVSATTADEDRMDVDGQTMSRTELDSHANMPVVGKHCYIIQDTGRQVDVSPFSPDYDALEQVRVVDAALLYVDPMTGEETMLVLLNALHVPAMINNLIPPFVMREAGLEVNDKPMIHC